MIYMPDDLLVVAGNGPQMISTVANPEYLEDVAFKWFSLDVANGDARPDTIKTYIYHFGQWLKWCVERGVDPGAVTESVVMEYRHWLINVRNYSSKTIQLKLIAMRRFYHSAHKNGLIRFNPVADVKAPPDRSAKDVVKNFSRDQVMGLSSSMPGGDSLKAKRDRAMIALMLVEGIRRVSVMRANAGDLHSTDGRVRMLVRGKGKDYYVNLSQQTIEIVNFYLLARGRIVSDTSGEPLFAVVNKWGGTGSRRVSRDTISAVTDKILRLAEIKEEGKACHALRHTCGHLIWIAHKDLKKVQMQLGHTGLEMAAKYSHIEDATKAQISESITVNLRG